MTLSYGIAMGNEKAMGNEMTMDNGRFMGNGVVMGTEGHIPEQRRVKLLATPSSNSILLCFQTF